MPVTSGTWVHAQAFPLPTARLERHKGSAQI